MSNDIQTTLYFVGVDRDEAMENWPFDCEDAAEDYRQDNPGTKVFEADVTIHLDTMRPVG